MADSIWISTTGDLNAAASYSPSGVPGAAGDIAFNGSSHVDVLSNLAALSAVDLTRVWTQPDYEGDIGASGNALNTAIQRAILQGSGSISLAMGDHASGKSLVLDSPNQQDALDLVSNSGNGTNLFFVSGGAIIRDSVTSGFAFVVGRSGALSPAITIGSSCTFDSWLQKSGTVTTRSVLGTSYCLLAGGLLTYEAIATAAWTTAIVITGGVFRYNSAATATQIWVIGGTLDMSGDSRAKTISRLFLMPGSNFITHNNITVTPSGFFDLRGAVPVLP